MDAKPTDRGHGVIERAVRRTPAQVAVVAGLAVAVGVFLAFFAVRHGFFDLKVYYGAINYRVHDGGMLYDYLKPQSKYGFTYPPFAALVMLPMAVVPWPVAIVISVVLSVAATVALLRWLVLPVARRHGWTPWFALAVAFLLVAAFEPYRETVSFGQVNVVLLFLVALDLLVGLRLGRRWAGVGIGLATAIKLTPGIFIVYLLVTRRWRAAIVSMATATVATLVAAAVDPAASREFWTDALWDTNRVGSLSYISNQSLQGFVARLDPDHPSTPLWLVLALVVFGVWVLRVRVASLPEGLALTGVVGCLLSPVTWVHHLVWLLPAIILVFAAAVAEPRGSRRRRGLFLFGLVGYVLLCSRLVWWWEFRSGGFGAFLGSNAYVYVSLALLFFMPVGSADRPDARDVADLVEPRRVTATR